MRPVRKEVRLSPDESRQLNDYAKRNRTTVQDVLRGQVQDFLQSGGRNWATIQLWIIEQEQRSLREDERIVLRDLDRIRRKIADREQEADTIRKAHNLPETTPHTTDTPDGRVEA